MSVYPGASREILGTERWQVKPLSRIYFFAFWTLAPATIVEFVTQKCADIEESSLKKMLGFACARTTRMSPVWMKFSSQHYYLSDDIGINSAVYERE